jgi:hypothetical protein
MARGGAQQGENRRVGLHVVRDAGQRDRDWLRQGRSFQRRGHPPGIAHVALAHDLHAQADVAYFAGEWSLTDMNCAISGRSTGALGLNAGMRPCVGLIVAMPLQ